MPPGFRAGLKVALLDVGKNFPPVTLVASAVIHGGSGRQDLCKWAGFKKRLHNKNAPGRAPPLLAWRGSIRTGGPVKQPA